MFGHADRDGEAKVGEHSEEIEAEDGLFERGAAVREEGYRVVGTADARDGTNLYW